MYSHECVLLYTVDFGLLNFIRKNYFIFLQFYLAILGPESAVYYHNRDAGMLNLISSPINKPKVM